MKIGLLNLPTDNNLGGNLQRYALVTVLQEMGHDVSHLQLRFHAVIPLWKRYIVYLKRIALKYVFGRKIEVLQDRMWNNKYRQSLQSILPFYNKHVPHTSPLYNRKDLTSAIIGMDAIVVGSDQVWRKQIAGRYLPLMFLDFVPDNMRKVAYAASLGVDAIEYTGKEARSLGRLYARFSATSVREDSSLSLLDGYGWTTPKAKHLLDPTFLISKEQYKDLVEHSTTPLSQSVGDMFCYILDMTDEKQRLIESEANKHHLKPFILDLQKQVSIEQWLKSFMDAKYIVTDSYHGMVFSIIFNKSYLVVGNSFRGMARFDSICKTFGVGMHEEQPDWEAINKIITAHKAEAISYIQTALQ